MVEYNIAQYTCKIFSEINNIDIQSWNSFIHDLSFFQSYQFLNIIENTQKQVDCRYCTIYENEVMVGLAFFQLIDFKLEKLMQYNSSIKSNFINRKIKNYFAKKHCRLLNLGNVFFTGDKGIVFEQNNNLFNIVPELFDVVASTYNKKVQAYLTSNIALNDERKCANFPVHGFHHLDTEPDMLMKLQNEWSDFEKYIQAMSSKYRVRTKKVLSQSACIEKRKLSVNDVKLYKNEIDVLFSNVMKKATFNLAELDTDFFIENFVQLPHIFEMYGYFIDGKMCGFSSLYICKNLIHVHYIGLDYETNHTYKLYNRMLLDVVQLAIQQNIHQIHFGRTATEIKSTIGAKPIVLNAYLKVNNRFLNRVAPYFLKRIKVPHFVIRNPFRK